MIYRLSCDFSYPVLCCVVSWKYLSYPWAAKYSLMVVVVNVVQGDSSVSCLLKLFILYPKLCSVEKLKISELRLCIYVLPRMECTVLVGVGE